MRIFIVFPYWSLLIPGIPFLVGIGHFVYNFIDTMIFNRIKIVSDGTIKGTYVCNSETGLKINGVTNIKMEFNASQTMANATVEFLMPILEIEAPLEDIGIKVENKS